MKKIIPLIFVLTVFLVVACQQARKGVAETKENITKQVEAPKATTGEAVVDAVGKDLSNVDTVEKDLSTDELNDLDSGLADVQNI